MDVNFIIRGDKGKILYGWGRMNNKISSDLLRGHSDTMILKQLMNGDKYGYEITRLINSSSAVEYEPKEATMYSSLKRLENEGCIISYWGDESLGGRRKYYTITEKGRLTYFENKKNWEYAKTILEELL